MALIEKHNANTPLYGSLGVVCLLDADTTAKAFELSNWICEQPLDWGLSMPHISLYHANLCKLDLTSAQRILKQIKAIANFTLSLSSIQVFGGKFIFWNVENASDMRAMHEIALTLSKYMDKSLIQRSEKEALAMSPKKLDNIKQYGYPLVRSEFLPHITIGYNKAGILDQSIIAKQINQDATIKTVKLARIGEYGSISATIDIY